LLRDGQVGDVQDVSLDAVQMLKAADEWSDSSFGARLVSDELCSLVFGKYVVPSIDRLCSDAHCWVVCTRLG
jgi:hypothetical protein